MLKKSVYRIYFLYMSKREAKELMENSNLIDKKRCFMKKIYLFFLLYKNKDNTTYYQRHRDVALNKAKEYYKNNNQRLKEQAKNKYRNLSEEDKNKRRYQDTKRSSNNE